MLHIQNNPKYDKTIKFSSIQLNCFSFDLIDSMYPYGGYQIIGCISENNNSSIIDHLTDGKNSYNIYKPNSGNKLLQQSVGFIQVGDNTFVEVRKSRVLILILFFLLCIGLLCLLAHQVYQNIGQGNKPPTDPTQIENDDSQKAEGNSVTLWYTLSASSNTSSPTIRMYFGNPNSSTHCIKVSLYDTSSQLIGESELVNPGQKIEAIHKVKNLSAGEYYCYYIVEFYDMDLVKQPNIDTKIPQVKLTID